MTKKLETLQSSLTQELLPTQKTITKCLGKEDGTQLILLG